MEASIARLSDVPVALRDLWNPEACPVELLPWLAWSLSVETWNPAWPEHIKRGVVASAVETARRKGTKQSVLDAISALGAQAVLVEWFETTPPGTPHTFAVNLVINDARTNIGLRSEQFDHSYWINTNAAIAADKGIAPDGNLSAQKLNEVPVSPANIHAVNTGTVTITPSRTYTVSVFVKAAERTIVMLGQLNETAANYRYTTFDLVAGTVIANDTGNVGRIAAVPGFPGWWRIEVTRTMGAAQTSTRLRVLIPDPVTRSTNTLGTAGSGLWIFGAQIEEGAVATSYIKTGSTTVTRTDVQDSLPAEINRTKPLRSHYSVNFGASFETSINVVGILRPAIFQRLKGSATY